MNARTRWARLLFAVGVVGFFAGAVDPLEGSVVIAGGSLLLWLSEIVRGGERRPRRFWAVVFGLIALGVVAMFGLSALGGLGGRSGHSFWWGLLLLPYPIGWLLGAGRLAVAGFRALRNRAAARALRG